MKVAIVAGPDAGHAFPAFALAGRYADAGIAAVVFTGPRWFPVAGPRGIDIAELPGLDLEVSDDDADAGAKLGVRAARMAVQLAPMLVAHCVDLVVFDVITVAGSWAAQLCGLPAIELSPHPLYRPSRGLPPIGAGLAPGHGMRGRLRDAAMRAATARSLRQGERQRGAARQDIGLPPTAPDPAARFVATLPALEVPRPDWPADTHLIGPLLWEPDRSVFGRPPGEGPLVVVAPSTAVTGAPDMLTAALRALADVAAKVPVRVVISSLDPIDDELLTLAGCLDVVSGCARQDEVLVDADLVVCGGGHGMLAKSLLAGVPVVTVPGGGDQWELANRVTRQGAGVLVRPVTSAAMTAAITTVFGSRSCVDAARAAAASAADVADPVAVTIRVAETVRARPDGVRIAT